MKKLSLVALLCVSAMPLFAQDIASFEKQELPGLVTMYKDLHGHPELSHYEANTSALVASELKKSGYTVTDRVGVYPDGSKAYGVVGILKNGPGPTILIRGDMDALPVTEETGVPYASHVLSKNKAGQEVGVMHACGHDVHTTVLIGTARALAASKASWHGTVMIVGQPSEETIDGAKAMLADHLYERFGRPDMVIGLHDTAEHAAGTVAVKSGAAMASSTSIDVLIKGIGGHGARPNMGRDPIVLAALFITQLQTIVSREEDPQDPTVVTVGDIHGGTKRNIIPNEVKLELTTRGFSDKSRKLVIDGIRQMAAGIAVSAGLPRELAPVVTVLEDESAPLEYNEPALTAKARATLVKTLGTANVEDEPAAMGSEDVGVFGLDGKIPVLYYRLGSANPEKLRAARAAGKELPGWHTSRFEPDPEPTLATGVKSLTAVAISLLQ
jgi:hippurate hydrolase